MSAIDWTIVLRGDWHLPHLINMLDQYRGNGEQRSCADEMIAQVREQSPTASHPLVVIDVEARDQVNRLADAFCSERWSHADDSDECDPLTRHAMQAALRSLTADPKPEEPTARWSVVVDRDEDEWVRVLGPDFADGWVRAGALPSSGKWTHYSDIAAVKVLSEGVTP